MHIPGEDWDKCADPEEMQKTRVDLADRVKTSGTYQAPDYRGGVNSAAVGAGKAVALAFGANAVDIRHHPGGDACLGEGTEDLRIPVSENVTSSMVKMFTVAIP